ncbi:MAG: Gfo/Idh/MocA family oxidoreductase [Gemmataceae bacterium]|nr:Gfo/Idh/MocA family oxidoreductase [Gemmataceae bacterium]MDW8264583.1 Gfo/Idh/MocA family oxidoreductase [Gemmataceae bacterium]
MTNRVSSTRRDFLKSTAAAGTAWAANLSLLSNVHAAGSDTIKVGVIGCGGRGKGAADNVLHAAPNVEIVAIGDVFQYRVNEARRRLKQAAEEEVVKQLGNRVNLSDDRCYVGLDCYEKVINTPGVNYVILATPPGFRPMHLEAAVAAGKHIFTEKPVAVDGPGVRKCLAAYEEAVKKKLCIAAGTQRRHQLGYIETIKRIHDGAIGDIVAARCYWNGSGIWFRPRQELIKNGCPNTDLAYQLNNWYHFLWTCGDHIVEQHVHNLDVINWALKAHPTRCVGVGARQNRPQGDPKDVGNIYDHFAIDYEYPGGIHVFSMCRHTPGSESNVSEALVGTKGMCQVNAYTINGQRVIDRGTDRKSTDPYVQEHTDLINAIRNGPPLNELKNVTESTLTAIMGRMSAYTGKPVTWERALASEDNTMPAKLEWDMSLPVPPVPVPGKTPLL